MYKVAIIGSQGKMGSALSRYLPEQDDMQLFATLERGGNLESLLESGPDCVVDLSNGAAVDANGISIVLAGVPYIIGATGFSLDTLERMSALCEESGSPVLVVPNFSIGANLMILFARQTARYMAAPVVTERHHDRKADAPSGTARYTAAGIAEARLRHAGHALTSTTEDYNEQQDGVLGGSDQGVAIHSIRGAGYLAEQQVLFSLPGESLAIEHRSIDRKCFMSGIAYCIRNISRVKGLVVGMDRIMEL